MNLIKRPLTGKGVLAWFLGFFALVFVANGAFVYFAHSSWTGLDRKDAYREGLAYNQTLAAAKAQKELGWVSELELEKREGGTYRMTATFADGEDAAIFGLEVVVRIRRPATDAFDRTAMLESIGEGRYAADIALPEPGQWDVEVEAYGLEEEHFIVEKRFFVE